MKKKILIVDDEPDIIEFIGYNLQLEGFDIVSANDGEEALVKVNENPDLIILDIMMPKLNGFEVLSKIREIDKFAEVPILFLTAKTSEIDEIKGLNYGADDYLKKPVSPMTVVARVKSILRRMEKTPISAEPISNSEIIYGPLKIDYDSYRIFIDENELSMPKKEFEIVSFLFSNPGKVYSRKQLLEKVWDDNIIVTDRTIDVHIRKIREKFGEYSDLIETIKGVGYRVKSIS